MTLIDAARALIERWDTPAWKDAPHTGEYIHALRTALADAEATTARIDQIAVNAWKLRMVYFDEDGHPTASRQPEPVEIRQALAEAEKPQPVAHLWQHSETGRTRIVMPDQIITVDKRWAVVGPLYLTPQPVAEAEPQHSMSMYASREDYEAAVAESSSAGEGNVKPVAVPSGWLRAIDEALVCSHLDVANADDSYETAKRKLNTLLAYEQDIGAYFANRQTASPAAPAQVPLTDYASPR